MNDISVILRVKNEERWIGHTIQSIIDFFDNPQIIVIDNISTDRSMEIVSHFKKDPSLKSDNSAYANILELKINDYTPGKALNFGVKSALSDTIMIVSSHCVIKKLNFNNLKKNLKINAAIFGKQIPVWLGKKIKKKYVWLNFGEEECQNLYSDFESRYFFHNAFSFFKKETLLKYKFNENLVGKEDRYWANDRIAEGYKILYSPENIVEHHYTDSGNTWKSL
tara:strand:- start:127 stop:795 length:669 start_codon:yes stop_codon:yes gene_type:complete